MNFPQIIPCTLLQFLFLGLCTCLDTISITQPIRDGDALVSNGETFALGFFTPGKPNYQYVGIWCHKIPQKTIVWVANRDNPINNTSGFVSIDTRGNLVVVFDNNDQTVPVWSTNASALHTNDYSVAQLLDSGNLVLFQNESKKLIWQSFDYPTNTMLPNMKLGLDRRTGLNRILTSWKSEDDPRTGNYTYMIDPNGYPQLMLYKGQVPWWPAGHWNGIRWSSSVVPNLFKHSFVTNDIEISCMWSGYNTSILSIVVVSESGFIEWLVSSEQGSGWKRIMRFAPTDPCDQYGHCGTFGLCDPTSVTEFECTCLPGFEHKSPSKWYLRDASHGCVRKPRSLICSKGEEFVKLANVKVPDTSNVVVISSLSLEACENECLRNCNCTAYASANISEGGSGCITWHGNLIDTKKFADGGQDFYIRVNIERDKLGQRKLFLDANITSEVFPKEEKLEESSTHPHLPFFDIRNLITATDNFSATKMLGEGGFGSVYKGELVNGQEIAVKRLSKHSGQGMQEFKNEVRVIAKLQHRNLVKLVGCCIHKEEKMLIYEYLPNKSLDYFIFDASMNPKISDFGMAKMFGEDQIQAKTNRVAGTYGYMSPEYAMKGLYSTKSDVFSFGVLLLEIVSGRKNTRCVNGSHFLNLIGHVWNLWKEGRELDIVDPTLCQPFSTNEVSRCIHVGLLCVQEAATDRPTMSAVTFMLAKETSLPLPNTPAFIFQHKSSEADSLKSRSRRAVSLNSVTITTLEAR
ncbi:hypothetical protein FNV43_RR01997 [Rhamnella rubrinervis]|uniref:Receptor-like serine/threonine-protein kinase n=1 Tax=Rhamnella rubrinervis TaxID=2594499 RepID=A0A8K0MTS0_9ROSA|nr:hypothetical protein FNV43_RR01997 [Rhamnella rubrinervis]